MFEFITDGEERGQVGIGTLIVFIAMVLVAAIAAGVLINTAGLLQSQAEATGEESTDLVSERIEVTNAYGTVDDGGTVLSSAQVTVTAAPGAKDIDLSQTIVQVNGPEGQETLTMAEYGANTAAGDTTFVADGSYTASSTADSFGTLTSGDSSTADLSLAIAENTDDSGGSTVDEDLSNPDVIDPRTIPPGYFVVVNEDDELVGQSEAVLSGDGTEYTIVSNPQIDALGGVSYDSADGTFAAYGPSAAFGQGEDATLDIVSPASATTQVELRAPDLFDSEGEAVRL